MLLLAVGTLEGIAVNIISDKIIKSIYNNNVSLQIPGTIFCNEIKIIQFACSYLSWVKSYGISQQL